MFAALGASVWHGGWAGVDAAATAWLAGHVDATGVAVFAGLSAWHAPRGILLMTALGAALLLWRRGAVAAATLPAIVLSGAALNHVVKHALQRPRPGLEQAAGLATDFAFPSGHVANATLLYGALACLLLARAAPRWQRPVAALPVVALVAGVALSRLVLNAHRLSDVVAAVPLALGWLLLCLAAVETIRGTDSGGTPRWP